MIGLMDLDSSEEWRGSDDQLQEKQHFHVLAVDDSLIDRKFLERLLTVSSYQVTCVDSGDKALQYLGLLDIDENEYERSTTPSSSSSTISSQSSSSDQRQVSKVNLIMTDYSMPGMNGYDLLKRIKESSWKDIPVVVMSSENVPSRINKCLEGGAEEFLLKPVKEADLRKLHSHLLMISTDTSTNSNTKKEEMKDCAMNSNNNNINMANKRKATLTSTSSESERSRPRVVQELPVS